MTANGTNVETGCAKPGGHKFESLAKTGRGPRRGLRTCAEIISSIQKTRGKSLLKMGEGEVKALDERLLGFGGWEG